MSETGVSFSDITNAAISTGDITVNGATAADVSHAVLGAYKQGIAESAEQIRELSGKLGITEKAIAGFLETLHEAPIALELIPAKFQELAARYQRLLDTVRTLQSDDSEVQRLRTEAATAIETGPALYDQAEELLERAEAIDRGATEQLAAALEARKLSAAASRMQRGELSLVRLDYEPTANLWDDAVIEKIINAVGLQGGLVVMDEAYQPFSSKSYIDRIAKHRHVLLLRTLSKFGLAGVRLGYLMGPKALIAEVDKVRPPYNISVLNYECALFALEHQDVFASQARELVAQRTMLLEALGAMRGVKAWKSDANMILVRILGNGDRATPTFEGMRERKVLVKNVSKMHSLLDNCLRLTVGTVQENLAMLSALEESL